MGVFDELQCELPLPGSEADRVNWVFQTKSLLDCGMEQYRITKEGRLVKERWRWLPEHSDDCASHEIVEGGRWLEYKPCDCPVAGAEQKPVQIGEPVDQDWHGYVRFYTGKGKDDGYRWWEYNAKFTDGKCVEIKCVFDGLTREQRRGEDARSATPEQIAAVARDIEVSYDSYGLAFPTPSGPSPLVEELKRTEELLAQERAKIMCPTCGGRGRIVSVGPYHSFVSECYECRGEGRVDP